MTRLKTKQEMRQKDIEVKIEKNEEGKESSSCLCDETKQNKKEEMFQRKRECAKQSK